MVPCEEDEVMEPSVMITISASCTCTTPVEPDSAIWISLTVMYLLSRYERLVTLVPIGSWFFSKRRDVGADSQPTIPEINALLHQVCCYGQDDRIVLVVWRAIHSFQCVDPWQLMEKSMEISSKLHSAVPGLESKPTTMQISSTRFLRLDRRTLTLLPT